MIEYRNVWKYYGEPVVKNFNLTVRDGEIRILLGPNGSGKSTLFRMSVGVVKPEKGSVLVNGVNPAENPVEARKCVGYIPEEPLVYESLEVREHIEFILSVFGVEVNEKNEKNFNLVTRALGLDKHFGKLVGELSHGNRRKVMLASIMLRDCRALVLDEVFSGLDVGSARAVKTWIREKARSGIPVLLSTHILPLAESVADSVTIIYHGEVVAEGTPEELKSMGRELEDVYLKLTGYSSEIEELLKVLR